MIVRSAFKKSVSYKNSTCHPSAPAITELLLSRAQTRHCSSIVQSQKRVSPLTCLTPSIQQYLPQTHVPRPQILSLANVSKNGLASFSTDSPFRSKNNPRKWPSDKPGSSSTGGSDQDVSSRPAQTSDSFIRDDTLRAQDQESETPQNSQQDPSAGTSRQSSSQSPDDLASAHDQPQDTATEAHPRQPLPDLTQGIPPTFDREYGSGHASAKRQESETTDLDLTEESTRERGDEDHARAEYVSSIERRRNAIARYMYITAFAMIAAGAISLGQDWSNAEEEKRHPEAPNGWHPWAFYSRIKARIAETMGYYTEPTFPKLLPTLDSQFGMPPYTLVLSLEDLLVHSEWSRQSGWDVAKRPGVDYFIRYLSQYYELVIFTTVPSMNAEMVIKKLDPYQIVMFPLFREATRYMKGEHVKDLSYLNRDLSKTLIIDTNAAHTQLQPENSIILPKWKGKPGDKHAPDLVAMIPFLEYIASMEIQDVRKVLKSYEGSHIPTEFARREARQREAFNKKLEEQKSKRGGLKGVSGGLGGLIGMKPSSQAGMQMPGEQSISEGLAQGKMLSDQIRERGQKQYEELDRQIREHGNQWLEEMEREQKKAIEESMKSVQSGMTGWPGRFMGWLKGEEEQASGGSGGQQPGQGSSSQKPPTASQDPPLGKSEDEKTKKKKKWWQIM
ncbi:MAG: mitochondrial inner membrane protein required for protein import [Alyxoria varia]|nr:MAG: mitochondrial inner membrane protein required for protein import [Alyxoria varia]